MTPGLQTAAPFELQLKALADPTRRQILELLRRKGCCSCDEVSAHDPGLCVCDLTDRLPVSQPTITHHLKVLEEAGLIKTKKIGRWVYCRRDEASLDLLAGWLKGL